VGFEGLFYMFDSGITTLNIAVSGHPNHFAGNGNICSLIGDSDSGKTMLALTIMAASFYRLKGKCSVIFYDFEFACQFNMERLFGKKFAKALIIIRDRDMTIELWQADLRKRYDAARRPVICAMDSTDALKCSVDTVQADALKKNTLKAGFGTGNALAYSASMPHISKAVSNNKGFLILLSQVRGNVGELFGPKLKRSNGKSLNFYSDQMVWLAKSTKEKIGNIKVGGWTRIDVQRNKLTGESYIIFAPVYAKYGIDDTRSMLHFLAECEDSGVDWGTAGLTKITVGDKTMTLSEMAAYFEGPETKDVLKQMVVDAWAKREAMLLKAVLADRKPRFG
jgi:RecA/RadA recombinase